MLYVTLINRTSKTLGGTWDGRSYELAPGKHSFPEAIAVKFKEQNPIKGTLDPYSGDREYLMGIVEYNDPTTPIEQSDAVELLDRSKMDTIAKQAVVIQTLAGRLYQSEKSAPLPTDNAFVSPKV